MHCSYFQSVKIWQEMYFQFLSDAQSLSGEMLQNARLDWVTMGEL